YDGTPNVACNTKKRSSPFSAAGFYKKRRYGLLAHLVCPPYRCHERTPWGIMAIAPDQLDALRPHLLRFAQLQLRDTALA
ncbi:hypothetical protein KC220_27305, partial [Mycobacterium tuberculosis]|nr:hypothetical protein [Mycobacterium tuberculosis]